MGSFHIELRNSSDALQFLKDNLSLFNGLSDKEIVELFDDKGITDDLKGYLMSECKDRINRLPSNLFARLVQFISNGEVLLLQYGDKLDTFSYSDLITILYDTYCEDSCVEKILCSKRFEELLQEEKFSGGTYLQAIKVCFDMFLLEDNDYDGIEEIVVRIEEILGKKQDILEDSTEMTYVVNQFFPLVLENMHNIDVSSNVFKVCINLIGYKIKCHKMLDSDMINFYVRFRLRELRLDNICKKVVIDYDSCPNTFGNFQASTETMTIYYNFVEKKFLPLFEEHGKECLAVGNDFMNLLFMQMLSHEISHVNDSSKTEQITKDNSDFMSTSLEYDAFFNYWWRNGVIRLTLSDEQYYAHHGDLIEENRADIFAMLDFGEQLDRRFGKFFSKDVLERFSVNNAIKLIELYTEKREKGYLIKSPMKKFDAFFKEHCVDVVVPDGQKVNHLNNDNSLNVLKNLFLGDTVPKDLILSFDSVRRGSKKVSSIYALIVEYVNSFTITPKKLEEDKVVK